MANAQAKYRRMSLSELKVDSSYQRPLDERRVAQIVKNFEPKMLGTLEVSRHNGKCAIFDGQHRYAAAKKLKLDSIPCLVHEGMTQSQEADLFNRLQRDRKPVHPVHALRARRVAGDEAAVAIYETVEAAGYKIGTHPGPDVIASAAVLERLYEHGVLPKTLELLGSIWRGDESSTSWVLLQALGQLVEGYGHRIDERAMSNLRAMPPLQIIRNARSRQLKVTGGSHQKSQVQFVLSELRKAADLRGPAAKRPSETGKETENGTAR